MLSGVPSSTCAFLGPFPLAPGLAAKAVPHFRVITQVAHVLLARKIRATSTTAH